MKEQVLTDSRIEEILPLASPAEVIKDFPQSEKSAKTVIASRRAVENIVSPDTSDNRLLIIVGPCSVHDPDAAMEYAAWLKTQRDKYSATLEIVMRTYLEKPRTKLGWKGIINDPDLDNTSDVNKGLRISRKLLCDITELGLPVSYELLSARTPQYISDLISWAAVGARTTESQLHRELVSGVSFPVGFKNGTSGSIQIVADAIAAAKASHIFMGIDLEGRSASVKTRGNPYCHTVLRGSNRGPNYDDVSIEQTTAKLREEGLNPSIMIDCSHANSNKDYRNQELVAQDIARQIASGNQDICGIMIESNLVKGRQDIGDGKNLTYGQSITDSCVGIDSTSRMLEVLSEAVKERSAL